MLLSLHKIYIKYLRRNIFLLGIFLYWICYGIFYPDFYSIQDERIYLAKAYAISQGHFISGHSDTANSWIDKYPPGQALLLSGLLKIGYQSIYILNPICLTLITFVLAAFLAANGIPRYFALLALYHPALFIYSRTLMSDIPAAFFFLFALWLLLYRHDAPFLGAVALGFTISLRVAMVPFAGMCLIYSLWKQKDKNDIGKILVGFCLSSIPFFHYIYQTNFMSASAYSGGDLLRLGNFIPHFTIYFLSLNTVYPLTFIAGIIPRYREDVFLKTLCVIALLLFPFYSFSDPSDAKLSTVLVLSQRYFLFIMSPLLIGYSLLLMRRLVTNELRFMLLLVPLVGGAVGASFLHQQSLHEHKMLHTLIYKYTTPNSLLITDDQTEELVLDIFGQRTTLNTEGKSPQTIFGHINASRSGDIFLIYLNRDGEGSWQAGNFILRHYRSEEVVDHQDEWHVRIFRLLPKYDRGGKDDQ